MLLPFSLRHPETNQQVNDKLTLIHELLFTAATFS